jgi:hypothetical protein
MGEVWRATDTNLNRPAVDSVWLVKSETSSSARRPLLSFVQVDDGDHQDERN